MTRTRWGTGGRMTAGSDLCRCVVELPCLPPGSGFFHFTLL